jgi:hypothetical protein
MFKFSSYLHHSTKSKLEEHDITQFGEQMEQEHKNKTAVNSSVTDNPNFSKTKQDLPA